jgi:hypothetical protein
MHRFLKGLASENLFKKLEPSANGMLAFPEKIDTFWLEGVIIMINLSQLQEICSGRFMMKRFLQVLFVLGTERLSVTSESVFIALIGSESS